MEEEKLLSISQGAQLRHLFRRLSLRIESPETDVGQSLKSKMYSRCQKNVPFAERFFATNTYAAFRFFGTFF